MFLSGKKGTLDRKAYEIAYAICRVSEKIQVASFSNVLTSYGVDLLGAVARENYKEAKSLLGGIDYLVKLGVDMNYISLANGDIFAHELAGFKVVLDEPVEAEQGNDDVRIDDIFSSAKDQPIIKASVPVRNAVAQFITAEPIAKTYKKPESGNPAMFADELPLLNIDALEEEGIKDDEDGAFGETLSAGIEIRQSAILDRIRQSGNCRMKDFLEILPSASERTIRYDLESLIDRKLIERVGGGSATYYRPLD